MKTDIIKHDFKEGLPQEFEILDLRAIVEEHGDMLTTPHRAGFYHIIWFQQGSPTHLVDFNSLKIEPNTLLFLNKDTVQRYDNQSTFEGKTIIFTDDFFCKTELDTHFLKNSILFRDLFSISQIQVAHQANVFEALLRQMMAELQNTKDNSQDAILHNLLHNFLLHAERERRKQNFVEIKKGPDLDYVVLFRDLLEKEYTSQKQVGFYAESIMITEKRLNQATRRILGKTPKEFINDRVLLEAKRILAHTTYSIKEVAFQLGFDEPTNFIKYFRKYTQYTPAVFREKFISA